MLTPSTLWKRLTLDERLPVARAFWLSDEARDEQAHAVLVISQQKKFRPKTIAALDDDRKARHLAGVASLPEAIVARALVVYHLAEQRPMMSAFLDALGIAHDDGIISEEAVKPDPARLHEAAARLAEQFPPQAVSLYLNTLLMQDHEAWGALEEVPQRLEVRP
jgi:hypothetical protein